MGIRFHFKQHGEWIGHGDIDGADLMAPQQADPLEYFHEHVFDDGSLAYRVGKKAAGRLLDGRTWDEFPVAKTVTV